jgi:sortase A
VKDRRSVDELSIEELEAILRLRKRQARIARVREQEGRPEGREVLDPPEPGALPVEPQPFRHRRDDLRYSAGIEGGPEGRPGVQWSWVWDRFLAVVEVLALLGLLLIIVQLFLTVRSLNAESRSGQIAPSPTPTPLIDVAVLPSGHTPPNALGLSEPAPVPAHLRSLVEETPPLPVPTAGPQHARRIVIDAIGVDAPVVEGDDWEALKKGAGHHVGSANPGTRGNCVISAHNDIYGEIFRDLPQLVVGDEILVHTETQVHRYVVEQTRIIEPTEVSVMAPTSSPVLTLISCYPYGIDTHRIVVIASLAP